jgi:hypothetical protein
MNDLRAVARVTQEVGGRQLQDMVIFANCKPSEYYAQATDKYLNNTPIVRGQFNGVKVAHSTKWYLFITGEMFFYNEVENDSERGWYDEGGVKDGE